MAEKFLTTDQVAEMLQLRVLTVRKMIRVSGLPGIFMGKSYRIPESELLRWIDAKKIRRQ